MNGVHCEALSKGFSVGNLMQCSSICWLLWKVPSEKEEVGPEHKLPTLLNTVFMGYILPTHFVRYHWHLYIISPNWHNTCITWVRKKPTTSPWHAADFLNVTALNPFVCFLWAALWPFDPFVPHNTLPESRGSNSSWKSARPQNMLASQKAKIQSHPESCSHLRKLKIKATQKHATISES